MDADPKREFMITKQIWPAAVIALVVIFMAAWLASWLVGNPPTSAAVSKPPTLAPLRYGTEPLPNYSPQRAVPVETPAEVARSLPDLSHYARARVTVRPADPPAHTPKAPDVAAKTDSRQPEKSTSPVHDMFPVGDIMKNTPEVAHPYRQMEPAVPSFQYEGRIWTPTGAYADSEQVDLTPAGFALDGHDVYALSNASAPEEVLFLRSASDPDRYSIYRSNQS